MMILLKVLGLLFIVTLGVSFSFFFFVEVLEGRSVKRSNLKSDFKKFIARLKFES